jgi:hypothetical protein
MAQEVTIGNPSDVVDQKSIIEEQQETTEMSYIFYPNAKVCPYLTTIQNLTQEEKELICKITYREAGNQPIEGQRAVMEVILNRLNSDEWPDDIKTILSTPGQFTTWKVRNKITNEQLMQMELVLSLVQMDSNTVLPSDDYVYFNCANPKKNSIKIEGHWFWV